MSLDQKKFSQTRVSMNRKDNVSIETSDQELVQAITIGVNNDTLDVKKLILWSSLGVGIVATLVIIWVFTSQILFQQSRANATATSTYYAIEKLTDDANTHIQSFGVLDNEKGVYHIPIDVAIDKLTKDD